MTGSFSDYLEKKLLDHVLGGVAYTPPATVYVGLATEAITDATTGTTVAEPTGGAYARVAVTNNATKRGLRVVIEDIEHIITRADVAYLLGIEPDPVQTATIDLNGQPRYARGTTGGRHS